MYHVAFDGPSAIEPDQDVVASGEGRFQMR
jgi:hypothetical protein